MGWARCVLTQDWSHLPSSGWTPRGHQRLHDLSSQNRWIYQTDQKIENKSDIQTRQTELSNGPKEQEKQEKNYIRIEALFLQIGQIKSVFVRQKPASYVSELNIIFYLLKYQDGFCEHQNSQKIAIVMKWRWCNGNKEGGRGKSLYFRTVAISIRY